MNFLTIQSRRIEYVCLQAKRTKALAPTIVMLHEGLGSIAMWRDFPQQVADATGCEVLVYSRHNYGNSDPLGRDYGIDFMHKEALEALPEVLDQLNIKKPILFGHSDGGSIALIHAGGAQRDLSGMVLMAPHVLLEEISVTSIMAAQKAYLNTDLREKLSRYHAHVDAAFYGWANVWLNPEFLHWNIEEYLPPISCPILAIQGTDDEYGTMQQIDIIDRKVKDVKLLKLPQCRHSAHKDQPLAVLQAVADFVEKIKDRNNAGKQILDAV
ncbi:MAG: alpha/beta hydrolase [Deltaproteobacteria bacterium]|nr:MAG: alpha/beta hydrolase [Deltaproteobacteria bacterium]